MTWKQELQAFTKTFWKQLSPGAWFFQTLNQCQKWSRFTALRGRGLSVKQANITMMRAKMTFARRIRIFKRDGWQCFYCKRIFWCQPWRLEPDHIKALS